MKVQAFLDSLDNCSEDAKKFLLALKKNSNVTGIKCSVNKNGLARIECKINGVGTTIKFDINASG